MSYFLGDKPLETKGKDKSNLKNAIGVATVGKLTSINPTKCGPGCIMLTECPMCKTGAECPCRKFCKCSKRVEGKAVKKSPVKQSRGGGVHDAITKSGGNVDDAIAKIAEQIIGTRRPSVTEDKSIRVQRRYGSRKKIAIAVSSGSFRKQKEKTRFPPGLVVSEKAKAKMEEHQAKIDKKVEERAAKKAEQDTRWQGRTDVVERWKKWEEKQQAVKDKILAKWEAQDKKRAEKRVARLTKLAEKPEELEKEKKKMAEKDVKERLKRAKYMDHVEAKQLKALKKREHAQVRRDKIFNFFGGFLGWKKRAIPEIPQKTLEDWGLEGFSDLSEVDTKLSWVIVLALACAVFASTKTTSAEKEKEVIAAKRRKRKRKR